MNKSNLQLADETGVNEVGRCAAKSGPKANADLLSDQGRFAPHRG
ncbi:hypothetical protein AA0X65_20005 [Pseudomonas phoenicis]